ncbi:MAG: SCO family protein [Pirellulales bacterium]
MKTPIANISLPIVAVLLTIASPQIAVSDKSLSHPQTEIMRNVDFQQRLNTQLPLVREFVDEQGKAVKLGDYFGERPVLFVLAYYRCPMLCNQVLNGVLTSTNALTFVAGQDFEIVVVSFDPADSPSAARAKRAAYTRRYLHKEGRAGWHFLTGKTDDIAAVTQACGFRFVYDEPTDQYAHASGIMIATPDGRLSQYFYGIDYPTRDLRLALVESSQGRIGTLVDQLLLRCFHYDALTGRYGLAVMRLVQAGGILTVVLVGGFIFRSLRKERQLLASMPIVEPAASIESVGNALRGVPEAPIDVAKSTRPTERHGGRSLQTSVKLNPEP